MKRVRIFSVLITFLCVLTFESQAMPETAKKIPGKSRIRPNPIRNKRNNRQDRKPDNEAFVEEIERKASKSPISVQSVLIPRRTKILTVVRLCFLGFILISLQQCIRTAGYPYMHTIWRVVNGDAPMPSSYRPSFLDVHLARIMATGSAEEIPSISLPSSGALLAVVISALGFVATLLLPQWSIQIRIASDYLRAASTSSTSLDEKAGTSLLLRIDDKKFQQDLAGSSHSNDGKQHAHICALQPTPQQSKRSKRGRKGDFGTNLGLGNDHPSKYYFDFNQVRFYFDPVSMTCSNGGPALHTARISDLKDIVFRGISKRQRHVAIERYRPYNEPTLTSPTIQEAFFSRISSPLVLVQLLGRLLSLLEEGVHSLIDTGMLLAQHFLNSRQSVISSKQLATDVQTSVKDTSSQRVLRLEHGTNKKWVSSSASELIPGDIFILPQPKKSTEFDIPVDALLLDGQCLTNEAVLTGESVPQSKRALDFDEELRNADASLEMSSHQSSILFAGTSLVHLTATSNLQNQNLQFPAPKEPGLLCLALRTGIYSSKGQLVHALTSSAKLGAISNADSEKDAIRLIASLSAFALASCISLFYPRGQQHEVVPAYRRVIQCTRIACASIPSGLPLVLSYVARSCSRSLRQKSDVVCSEDGSLFTCAHVDTVVFDKTGTLTADTQTLTKLTTSVPGWNSMNTTKAFQRFVLAGSHSLVNVGSQGEGGKTESELFGDPLDLAALDFSGWKYNATDHSYRLHKKKSMKPSDIVQLWQIRSFPFDPRKRMSTALVLAKRANNSYSIWSLSKGSPESIAGLLSARHDISFREAYQRKTQELEARGYRSIAIGSLDLSNSSDLVDRLFPNGLSSSHNAMNYARAEGTALHRSDFETLGLNSTVSSGLLFSGFACFDASLRPSSKRIIGELRRAGINSIMLTGDSMDAALAVSWKVGLIKNREVAILETVDDPGQCDLRWRVVKFEIGNKSSSKTVHKTIRSEPLTSSSVGRIIRFQEDGKCAVAATGQALERVLEADSSDVYDSLVDKLSSISVIARATPAQKESVITCLKRSCGQTVMMCGDGVNDVAAMKASDVAVALLNGFGSEDNAGACSDIDDERRLTKLKAEKLGSNRKGPKQSESQNRMKARIKKARDDIDKRKEERGDAAYNMEDIKEILSITLLAAKEERNRSKSLKMGGGKAAQILAEERRNRTDTSGDTAEMLAIKPGEASLVASFSCLHPSIDGVEAILRAGVATAASALSAKKMVALQSLKSAYHSATLYRDGFRYGKHMAPIELYMWLLNDASRHTASCTPRPRLPTSISSRPSSSMFDPSCVFSIVAQAGIHLLSMAIGVNYGRKLQGKGSDPKKPGIKLSISLHRPFKVGKLLAALAALDFDTNKGYGNTEEKKTGLFRRPAFQPNYEANAVFIFSILQIPLVHLINHEGKPFCRTILESDLCRFSLLTTIFCLALILESFPLVNRFLELRPLPSSTSKLTFLGIASLNVGACVFCEFLAERFFRSTTEKNPQSIQQKKRCAADEEEKLLLEESKQNLKLVYLAAAFSAYLVVSSFWQ